MLKDTILREAQDLTPEITAHRRWLHTHPETGFELKETLEYVRAALEEMGIHPEKCGDAGLTATIGQGGKCLLLRADMDALPIREETGLDFASQNGRMHACGHDLHTAMLLGAAKMLKSHENELGGTVKLMFQPAEEVFRGSRNMIESGVLDNPKVDAAMMIHVNSAVPIPAGTVLVTSPGVSAPAADYFTIRVQGKGCHGSTPQMGVDAISAGAHILLALQEIHARELGPSEEAVLTIGRFDGGTAENVIADSAVLGGTIRTYDENTRKFLKDRIVEISTAVAAAFRASAEVTFGSGCPTLKNDRELSEKVTGYMTDLLGPGRAMTTGSLSTDGKPARGGGSEDFAYVTQQVPGLMLSLCAGEPAKGHTHSLHHPKVTFDESALPIGAAAFTYSALRWLAET